MTSIAFDAKVGTAASASGSNQEDGGSSSSEATSSHNISFTRETTGIDNEILTYVQGMLTDEGSASLSPTLSTLSVSDMPMVVDDIADFIAEQNEIMGKRIAVRAKVYEIESDDNGNFGIDWSTLYRGSDRFSFDLNTGVTGTNEPTLDLSILSDGGSRFQDTSALINMLNTNRDASLVTSSSVYTTNGRPVPVQIADEQHYLASVTSEVDDNGNRSFEMTPGKILSGFSMTLVPRIDSNGDVQMEMAMDISQLVGLDEFTVGGEEGNTIQLPNKTSKNFVQRVSIASGQTLMMGGLERYERSSQTDSIAGEKLWGLGGQKQGGKRKVMTLILITPYIMAK
jgi:type IVB pilus formation R64 PilN family outer membrane protein